MRSLRILADFDHFWLALCYVILCLPGLGPACTPDALAGNLENQIKAAYLYKFAAHIEWPAAAFVDATSPVTIGILGADEVAAQLNQMKTGRQIENRPLEVKVLKAGEALNGVHVLFIGQQENQHLKSLLDTLPQQPMLLITESAGALSLGSIINFVMMNNHIRFEVSTVQAERLGLKISARLLAVAQKIDSGRP